MTRFQINIVSATLLLNAYMLHAKPVLNQRQGGIEWLNNRDFYDKFGWQLQQGVPLSTDDPENGFVSASDGSTWAAETMDRWARDYLFQQDDANVGFLRALSTLLDYYGDVSCTVIILRERQC